MKKHKIEKIVMAGHIARPSIKDIDFDLNALKLIKNFTLDSKIVFFKDSFSRLINSTAEFDSSSVKYSSVSIRLSFSNSLV